MRIIRGKIGCKKYLGEDVSATFGNFDGVHLGHQELIKETIKAGKTSVVFTFNPHPFCVLKSDFVYDFLTTLDEKKRLIRELNPSILFIIDFDRASAVTTKDDFIKWLKDLNIKHIIAGYDWRFGHMGKGGIADLTDFDLHIVDTINNVDKRVSSTFVKKLLKIGNIKEANKLLGRNYSIQGTVVKGNNYGEKLGFRTANLDILGNTPPHNGVYAVYVDYDKKRYLGMCNIGHNPTINHSDQLRMETHIFNFDKMIYGEEIKISFIDFIRDEKKFADAEELIKQLENDKNVIITLFS